MVDLDDIADGDFLLGGQPPCEGVVAIAQQRGHAVAADAQKPPTEHVGAMPYNTG